ncbi:aggregation factor core [Leptothoe kymatousa TAU-MAC 1615]|uniref:Aggregation factor core n=1 Tax=Leptothoe kymatousa TAU-MAC 1615 TaxID=2364775 RepID=A0ABS5Y3K5_9CYAN|nr:aggregation factor core [Leptothoe kymatousa TAU-MAC 1615]
MANPDALPAGADPNLATVEVEFVEGAPKDRFVIQNTGACGLEDLTVALDLSSSAGGLIFDTSATGAGVEVFQPFEVEEGDIAQLVANRVEDGDTELALRIATLGAGDRASFTIDVDDTLPQGELGQIRVADSEISGARVTITAGDSAVTAAEFSNGSIARAQLSPCPSA